MKLKLNEVKHSYVNFSVKNIIIDEVNKDLDAQRALIQSLHEQLNESKQELDLCKRFVILTWPTWAIYFGDSMLNETQRKEVEDRIRMM